MGERFHYTIPGDDIISAAIRCGCKKAQLFKPNFTEDTIRRAKEAGLKLTVFWADEPDEAKKFLEMGIDTILTNDFNIVYQNLKD